MLEIEYHTITKEFLEYLKAPAQTLNAQLAVALETDFYILHLEFNEQGATLGFIVNNLASSQIYPLYQLIVKRIQDTKHEFCNLGVAIFNEKNISINTFIPNNQLSTQTLTSFYDYADNKLLFSLN